jgi:ketosteroid isomerase-like protein
MSQVNVEIVRKLIGAWNQHDADRSLSYVAPDIEWMPAGPAAVEGAVYRGRDEVASRIASVWEAWDVFDFREGELRDLGDSVLWLGRVKMRGSASGIELDQEFAIHSALDDDSKVTRAHTFLTWRAALEAVGLAE